MSSAGSSSEPMSEEDFTRLNEERSASYKKDERSEDFLKGFNSYLAEREEAEYEERPIHFPFIFVVGAPRSGTTLLSQVIAHGLYVSYIDNLAARFFLAPLHGMRFSRSVFGEKAHTDFSSHYSSTQELSDIHEFGYFWRELLEKRSFDDITYCKEREEQIDWERVRKVLGTMQQEAGRPMIFKNIMGGYHMPRFQKELGKVLFIHIVREERDAAVSILGAREKYNKDLRTWWSYQPLEYEDLKDRDPYEQVAGQVHCLRRFYKKEMGELPEQNRLETSYEALCKDPKGVLKTVKEKAEGMSEPEISLASEIPEEFPFSAYKEQERERFDAAFQKIREAFPS